MGELALLIPLAPFLLGGFAIWTRHQSKMHEAQLKTSTDDAARFAAHSQELEDRVRVLERIITDRGYDVATQIEALRSESPALNARKVEEKI